MTTRPQVDVAATLRRWRLARTLRKAALIVSVPAALSALLGGGLQTASPEAASTFTIVALTVGAVAAGLFLCYARVAPRPTRNERIEQVRSEIGELQDLLARLLRDNADQGVIAEVRALTAGLTVNPNDPAALVQARRRLALSAVEGSGAGPLAIAAAPATVSGGTR